MPITDMLAGKHAFIVGGAHGIGRGIAEHFAAQGASVSIGDVAAEDAAALAKEVCSTGGAATSVRVDVSDESSVRSAVGGVREEFGPIDVLVNSAGAWKGGNITELSVSDWDLVMSVNIRGAFLVAREVLPEMADRQSGSIIMIGSLAALKGTRRAGAYNPSKAAVIALTRNIAIDFAPQQVRANAICPGVIDGTGMDHTVRSFRNGYTEEYQKWVTGLHPMGRLGTPEDVAKCALFLASDESSWVTGSTFVVDGGCMTGY